MALLNIKIDKKKKEYIKKLIKESEFKSVSDFIRNVIDEKIEILQCKNEVEDIIPPDYIPDGKYYAIVKGAIVGVGDTVSSLAQEVGSKFPHEKIIMKRKNKNFPKMEYVYSAISTKKECWEYSLFNDATYPIIPTYIINQNDRIFIYALPDSAASLTLIKQEIVEKLKLKKIDEQKVQTASGIIEAPIYEIQIEINDRTHAVKIISAPISDDLPIQGLIGRNLLDHFDLYLLGKRQIVCLK